MFSPHPRPKPGFTLLELLCVMAIIGVLSALLFPSFGAVRRAAARARTKAQFAQWTAAIEAFRSEYGYYPAFDASNLVNGGVTSSDHPFHDVLAGRRRDGAALTVGSAAAAQNRKAASFASFVTADFTDAGLLRDGFDGTAIAVLVDRDLDGVIRAGSDFPELPQPAGYAPSADDFPAAGIRAGVVFYAPLPGGSPANPEFIASWK